MPVISSAAAALVILAGVGIVLPKLLAKDPRDTKEIVIEANSNSTEAPSFGGAKDEPDTRSPGQPPGYSGGNFSITRVPLAETASRHEYAALVRIDGAAEADGFCKVTVKKCFRGSLPENIFVRFPITGDVITEGEENKTVADVVLARGGECIVFLDELIVDSEFFWAAEIIWREPDGSAGSLSVSDIEGSDYSAVILALPGIIRDNPYIAPETKGSN